MKFRYIAAGLIIAISITITPACIEMAEQYRGYQAYGGEYLIIPLGLMAAGVVLDIAKLADKLRELKKHGSFKQKKDWEWDYGKCR